MRNLYIASLVVVSCATASTPTAVPKTNTDLSQKHFRADAVAVEAMEVASSTGEPTLLEFNNGEITILTFFATWCPHCRDSMGVLNAIYAQTQQAPWQGRVKAMGVRTAVEREKFPVEEFLTQYKPQFPIYTDETMAMVFARFTKTQNIATTVPIVAVIDGTGKARYLFTEGDIAILNQQVSDAVTHLLSL